MKKEKILIWACKIIFYSILASAFINMIFFMRYNFKADSAFYITLAREQIRTGCWFPEGVSYSTALFTFTPNLLMIPLMHVVSNAILARQLAIAIVWLVMLILLYHIMTEESNKELFYIASSLFMTLYIRSEVVDMHFYQGAYVSHLLFYLLFLFGFKKVMYKKNQKYIWFILILIIEAMANSSEIRSLLIFGIPAVIAYGIFSFVENHHDIKSVWDDSGTRTILFVLMIGCVVSFLSYIAFGHFTGFSGTTESMVVLPSIDYCQSILDFITDLFSMHGNLISVALLSVNGIFRCINTVVCILIYCVVPYLAIKQYQNYESLYARFMIVFCLTSNAVYSFVAILVGGASITDRYLVPVYNNAVILTAIVFSGLLRKQGKLIKRSALFCILSYSLLCNGLYLYNQKNNILSRGYGSFAQGTVKVAEQLEEKGLQYGYATFYNAEEYSALTNNRVQVHNVVIEEDVIKPFYWLTVDRYYDPSNYIGETFLMVSDDELQRFAPEGISKSYLGDVKDTFEIGGFHVFVYDHNIAEDFFDVK